MSGNTFGTLFTVTTFGETFGYGKEEYFWSFIVAILLFALGGVYSVYEGVHKRLHPEELQHLYINFAILGVAVAAEGYSWWVARKAIGGDSISQITTNWANQRTLEMSSCSLRTPAR